MPITHPFVSPKADGADATLVRPSNWNAQHTIAFDLVSKDLGVSNRSGTFDITGLSGLTADKPVIIMQSASGIPSKGDARDEPEMDQIQATGYTVNTTTIRVYWWCPNVVVGTYEFEYLVGG